MAAIMSRCDFENSQISAQDTVGVAGSDIMFHILVWVSNYHYHDILTSRQ